MLFNQAFYVWEPLGHADDTHCLYVYVEHYAGDRTRSFWETLRRFWTTME
jgi:hypothetical protein